MYVLGNPQKRNIGTQISPVQFLCDRELDICDEKHGIIIRKPVSGLYSHNRKCTHGYETNITRMMKRDIDGIEM